MKHVKQFVQRSKAGESLPPIERYLYYQDFNPITKFLHSIRYRHLRKFISGLDARRIDLFEVGCGYGKSIDALKSDMSTRGKRLSCFGIDIDHQLVSYCSERHPEDVFTFADVRDYATGKLKLPFAPTAVIALECLEHINERDVPNIIDWLHSLNCPVFISVPNEIGPAVLLKNIGSIAIGYSGVRRVRAGYTWSETLHAGRYHLERVSPHATGHVGFDWRWLAAVINQKFVISKIGTSPWGFIPRCISPSIYFYCCPRAAKK